MNPKKILVIDDELGSRESFRMILKNTYDVLTTDSGEDAVEVVKKEGIHLVILDLIMPIMDGIETLKRIRKISSELKVIIVTAIRNEDIAKEVRILGVSGWITKPFDVNEVKALVQKILQDA